MCVSICYLAVHMLSLTVLPENGAEDKSHAEVIHDSTRVTGERESDGERDNDLVYQEHNMKGSEDEK